MIRIIRRFSSVPNTIMNMKVKNKFAIVEFNNPNSSVNVINKKFSEELEEIYRKTILFTRYNISLYINSV